MLTPRKLQCLAVRANFMKTDWKYIIGKYRPGTGICEIYIIVQVQLYCKLQFNETRLTFFHLSLLDMIED